MLLCQNLSKLVKTVLNQLSKRESMAKNKVDAFESDDSWGSDDDDGDAFDASGDDDEGGSGEELPSTGKGKGGPTAVPSGDDVPVKKESRHLKLLKDLIGFDSSSGTLVAPGNVVKTHLVDSSTVGCSKSSRKRKNRKLKKQLQLQATLKAGDRVETFASSLKRTHTDEKPGAAATVDVVVFNNRKKKKTTSDTPAKDGAAAASTADDSLEGAKKALYNRTFGFKDLDGDDGNDRRRRGGGRDDSDDDGFDMHRARFEVTKFGETGFAADKRLEARVAHAVRLGARPPKNPKMNYKMLQEERRTERDRVRLAADGERSAANRFGNMASKGKGAKRGGKGGAKKKRDKNDVRGFDAQPGRYRSGVQTLSKRDMKRFKSS